MLIYIICCGNACNMKYVFCNRLNLKINFQTFCLSKSKWKSDIFSRPRRVALTVNLYKQRERTHYLLLCLYIPLPSGFLAFSGPGSDCPEPIPNCRRLSCCAGGLLSPPLVVSALDKVITGFAALIKVF